MDKEKSDSQYTLDSEQKGIHARRDSDVRFNFHDFSSLVTQIAAAEAEKKRRERDERKAFLVIYDPKKKEAKKILKMDFFFLLPL